jgi:hypothetical protein
MSDCPHNGLIQVSLTTWIRDVDGYHHPAEGDTAREDAEAESFECVECGAEVEPNLSPRPRS